MLCQERRSFGPCMVYTAHVVRSGPEATNKVKLKSYLRKLPRYTVAQFYIGVNKDDNQMNKTLRKKYCMTVQMTHFCIKIEEDEQLQSH